LQEVHARVGGGGFIMLAQHQSLAFGRAYCQGVSGDHGQPVKGLCHPFKLFHVVVLGGFISVGCLEAGQMGLE